MTTFDDLFAAQGMPSLLATFGEEVVYRPRGGTPRTITAIVERNPPSQLPDSRGALAEFATVEVYNDDVTGISSVELNTGGDTLEFPPRKGGTVKEHGIRKIISQDGGVLVLEVR